MNFRIHFFTDRKNKISVKRIYEFFDKEIFVYSQRTKYVLFRYENHALDNKASFVFTQYNVISNIYTLNPGFKNIDLFVEFPLIISDYYLDNIMDIVERLAKMFDLYYYMELNQDIMPFEREVIVDKILDYRDRTLAFEEITKTRGKFFADSDKLAEICEYQEKTGTLSDYFQGKIDVNKYIVMRNLETDELALSIVWDINNPTIFPKHIDYVHVIFEDNKLPALIPAKDVISRIHRFLALLPKFVDGTRVLKPGSFIRKAKKVQGRLKKLVIDDETFEVVSLNDIIDERLKFNE